MIYANHDPEIKRFNSGTMYNSGTSCISRDTINIHLNITRVGPTTDMTLLFNPKFHFMFHIISGDTFIMKCIGY